MTAKTNKRNSTTEPRRANKPLMEKRRRARINQSLAALKTLILDTAKADNTKHSKLEKADILELTVRHFQRHRSLDAANVLQYRSGYADCVKEVQRYLDTPDAQTMTVMEAGVRQRLMRHLENCVSEVDTDLKHCGGAPNGGSTTSNNNTPNNNSEDRLQLPADSSTAASDEVNNNAGLQHGELPAKMVKTCDGNFVFVLPSHYLQLASALGINLRTQQLDKDGAVKEVVMVTPPTNATSSSAASSSSSASSNNASDDLVNNEHPIDFSRSNDDDRDDRAGAGGGVVDERDEPDVDDDDDDDDDVVELKDKDMWRPW